MANLAIDVMWDDSPVDVTDEADFIWSIANKLRGSYMIDNIRDTRFQGIHVLPEF